MPDLQALVNENEFLFKLKKRGSKIEGSQATARQTAVLLRLVISQWRIPHANQEAALIDAVKAVGEQLAAANPVAADKSSRSRKLKRDVIEAVNDLIEDIDTCHEQIAERAVEHIHHQKTVLEFLWAAKEKKRSFRTFVAEGTPRDIYSQKSWLQEVIVGAHAVLSNGGVIAPVGLNMVALAAQRHAVPFVVLAGSHMLCPLYPHNPEVLLSELRSPSEQLDFGEFSDCMDVRSGTGSPLLHDVNPTFDYVPPKLVSMFITDA